jgi:MoaA/NifB/PqqE/SkfB family radical SAM enzyme
MAGAMAGSAVSYYNQRSDTLQVLTLTINNKCNLSCPHCYLQYQGNNLCISDDLIDVVLASDFVHLAIVGKEPLVDVASRRICERLIAGCTRSGKTSSLITNAINLGRLAAESFGQLQWVDVSLDGGPETYHRYRRSEYSTIVEQAHYALHSGLKTLNALHTLCDANLNNIDDMVAVAKDVPWSRILFAPFLRVRNHGRTPAATVSIQDLVSALLNSSAFMHCETANLILGEDSFKEHGLNASQVRNEFEKAGLWSKIIQVPCDPFQLGYLRVTYDGYIMTPYQSLHPADYRSTAISAESFDKLEEAFKSLMPVLV